MPPPNGRIGGLSRNTLIAVAAIAGVSLAGLLYMLRRSRKTPQARGESTAEAASSSASQAGRVGAAGAKKKKPVKRGSATKGAAAAAAPSKVAAAASAGDVSASSVASGFLNRPSNHSDTDSATASTGGAPGSPVAKLSHAAEGNAFWAAKKFKQALDSYTMHIAESPETLPNLFKVYTNRANVLLRLKRPEDALADAERSLKLQPSGGALLVKGQSQLQLDQFAQSIETLEQVAFAPDASDFHKRTALSDIRKARDDLERRQEEAAQVLQAQKVKAEIAERAAKAEYEHQMQVQRDAQLAAIAAAAPMAEVPEAATSTGRSYAQALQDHAKEAPSEQKEENAAAPVPESPSPILVSPVAASSSEYNPALMHPMSLESSVVAAPAAASVSGSAPRSRRVSDDGAPVDSDLSDSSAIMVNASDAHAEAEAQGDVSASASEQQESNGLGLDHSGVLVAREEAQEPEEQVHEKAQAEPEQQHEAEDAPEQAAEQAPAAAEEEAPDASPAAAEEDPVAEEEAAPIPVAVPVAAPVEVPVAAPAVSVSPAAAAAPSPAAPVAPLSPASSSSLSPEAESVSSSGSAKRAPRSLRKNRATAERIFGSVPPPAAVPSIPHPGPATPAKKVPAADSNGHVGASSSVAAGPLPVTPPPPATRGWAQVVSAKKAEQQ